MALRRTAVLTRRPHHPEPRPGPRPEAATRPAGVSQPRPTPEPPPEPTRETTDEKTGEPSALDLPEVWGHGSFPASDPPANW